MSRDNRSPPPKRRRHMPEDAPDSPSEMDDSVESVEAIRDSSSSTCSSFLSSFSSCSTSYSNICSSPEGYLSEGGTPSPFPTSVTVAPSCPMVLPPGSQPGPSLSQQGEEGAGSSQYLPFAFPLFGSEIDLKISDLVRYLLHKYSMKDPTTKAEMLAIVTGQYEVYSQIIFIKACECLLLTFGIDIQPLDPSGHSYMLVPALGLTYDGCLCDVQGMPKTGLLIRILGIIYINGGLVREQFLWGMLGSIGVCAGQPHFLCHAPENLVTGEFVREGYLEFQGVPFNNPLHYEFQWGPRAHAEVSKMKILQYWTKLMGCHPTSYPMLYAEALRDEERAQARVAPADEGGAMLSGSSAQEAEHAASGADEHRQGFQ